MSITSGPTEPDSTGKSIDGVPSVKDTVASFSAMIFSADSLTYVGLIIRESSASGDLGRACGSRRAQHPENIVITRRRACRPLHDQVEQVVVAECQELAETLELAGIEARQVLAIEFLEYQVELEQSTTALPPDFAESRHVLESSRPLY